MNLNLVSFMRIRLSDEALCVSEHDLTRLSRGLFKRLPRAIGFMAGEGIDSPRKLCLMSLNGRAALVSVKTGLIFDRHGRHMAGSQIRISDAKDVMRELLEKARAARIQPEAYELAPFALIRRVRLDEARHEA